jgi:extracellular elastinolytic metalloproteinase
VRVVHSYFHSLSLSPIKMRSALFASLALAIAHTSAHPAQLQNSKPSLFKRTVNLESFRLKVTADYVNTTAVESEPSVKLFRRATTEDTATELVKKTVPGATFRLVEGYAATNGISHFYFKQTANGLDIDNADFNVNVSALDRS